MLLKNKIIVLFLITIFMSLGLGLAHAQNGPDIAADGGILVDAENGKILYQKNVDVLMPPASMTKMMTMYIILEAIKDGRISWDQKTQPSEYGYKISQKRNLSNVPLRSDGQYSIKELYEATAIYSANGAAITIAETIAGSESNFVKMMNDKAAQLGLKDYKFVNCTGLNNEDLGGMHPQGTQASDENMISARSAALLAYRLIKDFPEVLQTSSIPKKTFREGTEDAIKMDNWNWMLPGLVYAYDGMEGLKTGSSPTAGFSFTATAKRNNTRLITVIMKAGSYQARFSETRKLLDYGFANFTKKELFPAGYKIADKSLIPVVKGKEDVAAVATNKPLTTVIKRGDEKLYMPQYQIDPNKLDANNALIAPVGKGEKIGYMTVQYTGESNYGFLTKEGALTEQVPVVTTQEVKKANFIVLFFRWAVSYIKGLL